MQKLMINVSKSSYPIIIEDNIKDTLESYISDVTTAERIVLVTDETVHSIYKDIIEGLFKDSNKKYVFIAIPAGEKSKSTEVLNTLYNEYSKIGISKSDLIIAFGGGVVGDVTGFSAATYLRGVPFIQIPTTLTSQIDSSIGGKTAINLPYGKNLVGSFYQPSLVLIDPTFLKTLPIRVFNDGMAEAIKYGCIMDKELFEILATVNKDEVNDIMEDIIYRCCKIKKEVVETDEFDNGLRMILNFGHTIGHGIEEYYNYEKYTHGEAVAIGMYSITKKSEAFNLSSSDSSAKIKELLEKFNLPYDVSEIGKESLLHTMLKDKKVRGKNINLVLIKDIGEAFLHNVSVNELEKFI